MVSLCGCGCGCASICRRDDNTQGLSRELRCVEICDGARRSSHMCKQRGAAAEARSPKNSAELVQLIPALASFSASAEFSA